MNTRKYLTISQYLGNNIDAFSSPSYSMYNNINSTPSSSLSAVSSTSVSDIIPISSSKINITPNKWGPGLWYVLHTGSLNYPDKPTPIYKERMKNFILGIPYILPCDDCRKHALEFITNNEHKLDTICSSKTSLFNFFVDFHNQVNKRYNKKIYSYQDAYNLYTK